MRSPRSVTIVRDRLALADLELRDRLLRAARHRLLPGDARELVGAGVDDLRVRRRLAEAHVDDDLLIFGTAMTFL